MRSSSHGNIPTPQFGWRTSAPHFERRSSAPHFERRSSAPWDGDKLHEECGIFGIFGHGDAAAHTALGLHALQHRGQEAAGIVSCDGPQFHSARARGHVGATVGDGAVVADRRGRRRAADLKIDYMGSCDPQTLEPRGRIEGPAVALVAARVGRARLIDNEMLG